jgi:hypothetical protein
MRIARDSESMARKDNSKVAGVGLLVAAIGPPAAGVTTMWDLAADKPVTAGLLFVAYEVVVVSVAFAGSVVSDVIDRSQHRLVDYIDRNLKRLFTRFGGRYVRYVLSDLRFIDQRGLATIGYQRPELDDVFVDVSVAPLTPDKPLPVLIGDRPGEDDDPGEDQERQAIGDFLDQPSGVILALLGAPGSGKTTLLQHTARQVCRNRMGQRRMRGRRRRIPILLYLRDHASVITSNPHIGILDVLREKLNRYHLEEPEGWFDQRLRKGACVVLLDGLDEVARRADREKIAEWIRHQTIAYPGNDYVITSRPRGFLETPVAVETVLQVRFFTGEQADRFILAWYLAEEKRSVGHGSKDVEARARMAADDLLDRLRSSPGLYELTVNPLLLTMIANVHRYRGALPGSRADLYAEICEVMLWRLREAKKVPVSPRGDQKQVLLREVAFEMMQAKVSVLLRRQILDIIGSVFPRIARSGTMTAEEVLASVEADGLIMERENGSYAFSHLTFQEYLAAVHIRERGLSGYLVRSVKDRWWRETIVLYSARSDASPIVRACLANAKGAKDTKDTKGAEYALGLALECAEQASELEPDLWRRLNSFAGRQYARVAMIRHLRDDVARVGGGGIVCIRPVTIHIYGLFRQFVESESVKHIPDAPENASSGEDETVVGVRGSDAAAFVDWTNDLIGREPLYRLPARAEADYLDARRRLLHMDDGDLHFSFWRGPSDNETAPVLWTPAGTKSPIVVDSAIVHQHVENDIRSVRQLLAGLLLIWSASVIRVIPDLTARYDLCHQLAQSMKLVRVIVGNRADTQIELFDRTSVIVREDALGDARTLLAKLPNFRTINQTAAIDLAERVVGTFHNARTEVPSLDKTLARDMGIVLSDALSAALRISVYDSLHAFAINMSREFAKEATGAMTNCTVSLDTLADRVRTVRDDLANRTEDGELPSFSQWTHDVADRLHHMAIPVFNRQKDPTAERATMIRLLALCLAAEVDAHDAGTEIGDIFREIAAGVTLLERRRSGQAAPAEAILLASDEHRPGQG